MSGNDIVYWNWKDLTVRLRNGFLRSMTPVERNPQINDAAAWNTEKQLSEVMGQVEQNHGEIDRLRPFTSEEIEFLYDQLDNERNEENDNAFFWRLYEKLSLMRENPSEGGKR